MKKWLVGLLFMAGCSMNNDYANTEPNPMTVELPEISTEVQTMYDLLSEGFAGVDVTIPKQFLTNEHTFYVGYQHYINGELVERRDEIMGVGLGTSSSKDEQTLKMSIRMAEHEEGDHKIAVVNDHGASIAQFDIKRISGSSSSTSMPSVPTMATIGEPFIYHIDVRHNDTTFNAFAHVLSIESLRDLAEDYDDVLALTFIVKHQPQVEKM
ncbi:hypothetical protein EV213_12425 [Aureibacillus halotolerans]|uniref:Lipoprotein n=2 Tax=Aureibacillus halotolerans TaxID=1508390 RepID=A0A4R6TQ23_9BACI|nr:hypothetical protein EV213_12425 [Aureibacillus halotolerans]